MRTKPASTDANESTEAAVAGSALGGLDKFFPPIPSATRNTKRTGSHEKRSYLIPKSERREEYKLKRWWSFTSVTCGDVAM